MQEDQAVAPSEATDEDVREDQAPEQDQRAQDDPDQTDGEQPDPSPEEGEKDGEERKSRHQRRKEQMERLKREAREAEQRLSEQQERIRKAQEAAQGQAQPQEKDFTSYEEYLVALGTWHAGKQWDDRQTADMERQRKEAESEAERIREQQRQEVAQHWGDQVADAKTRYADFEQVAYSAPISDGMADVIAQMDRGADVAYHLGLHRDDAARIAQMSPIEQAMELARVEARLSAPQPRTQTKAPDPVDPVRPKASATKDPSKMTMAEYRKWRGQG